MEKQVANCSLQEEHEKLFNEIRSFMQEVSAKLDGLNVIHIINGNADGTPTMYTRDVFFQGQYNASKKVYDLEKKFDVHLEHTTMKQLNSFSSVVKVLMPIIYLLAFIIMLGWNLLSNKNTSDRQDKTEKLIERMIPKQ